MFFSEIPKKIFDKRKKIPTRFCKIFPLRFFKIEPYPFWEEVYEDLREKAGQRLVYRTDRGD